jgi:hypothetical protein
MDGWMDVGTFSMDGWTDEVVLVVLYYHMGWHVLT